MAANKTGGNAFGWKGEKTHVSRRDVRKYQISNAEEGKVHSPYSDEQYFMSRISAGDEESIRNFRTMSHEIKLQPGKMSEDPRKQAEYGAVLGVSFAFRAAIEGGVDPYLAYDLNDLYLQRISAAGRVEQYQEILTEGILAAVREVNNVRSRSAASPHISKVKAYIKQHITSELTLDILAENAGLSRSYLSKVFREGTGETLVHYISSERCKAAADMLRYTDSPINEIAQKLMFSSQSHFTEVFKRHTGLTPAAYRRKE